MPDDPGIWKQVSAWLWTLLAIPVAGLWRKVEAAVTKEELKDAVAASERNAAQMRENVAKLFENAENDRRRYDERFSKMQETLHGVHVDVLQNLRDRK